MKKSKSKWQVLSIFQVIHLSLMLEFDRIKRKVNKLDHIHPEINVKAFFKSYEKRKEKIIIELN